MGVQEGENMRVKVFHGDCISHLVGQDVQAYCFDGEIWFPVLAKDANAVIRISQDESGDVYMEVPDDLGRVTAGPVCELELHEGLDIGSDQFSAKERRTMMVGFI